MGKFEGDWFEQVELYEFLRWSVGTSLKKLKKCLTLSVFLVILLMNH